MKAFSWINLSLGVWLIAAALILSTRSGIVRAEEAVAGVVIVVLSYVSSVGVPSPAISWTVACAGIWTIILNSGAFTAPRTNAMIVGAVVTVVAALNAVSRRHVLLQHRS